MLAFVGSWALAGRCQAQEAPGGCELLVLSSQHQVIELHKPEYVLTETATGWNLKILSLETQEAIRNLDNPDISFCAGTSEVLARGIDVRSSAVPTGATAFYATQHSKISHFTKGIISLTLIGKVARR